MVKGQSNISTTTVIGGMIAIGVVGFVIDVLLRAIEARVQRKRGHAP
jgi:NitT/TauT family transport system permease protein